MNNFWGKYYRGVCFLVLAVVFIGWTMFLNKSEKSYAEEKKDRVAVVDTDLSNKPTESARTTTPEPDTEPSVITDTPDITEEPKITEAPIVTEAPEVTETPEITEAPEITETPEPTEVPVVTEAPEPTQIPVNENYEFKYAIANVVDKLNIRSTPSSSGTLLGYLPPDAHCEIIEWNDEWSKIKSGSITGYAYSKYLMRGKDAVEKLSREGRLLVKISSNSLNIRENPNTDSTVLMKASYGQKYIYLPYYSVDGWYCIQYSEDKVGYLSTDFASVYIDTKTAVPAD